MPGIRVLVDGLAEAMIGLDRLLYQGQYPLVNVHIIIIDGKTSLFTAILFMYFYGHVQ